MPVLAIDLGGTKLAAAVVDEQGRLLSCRKEQVDKRSPNATADQLAAIAETAVSESGLSWHPIVAAGLIVPGIADPTGSVWAPNLWGDCDVPLHALCAARIPVRARIDSDRSGYVLGEQWVGVAQGCNHVVFVAIGTGIGAGIISDGVLIRGARGIGGAVGWMALKPELDELYSAIGCWEAEAAGPAVARAANANSAEEVVAGARRGDPACTAALGQAAGYIGMGVANLISIFNPEIVVVGGGLMNAGDMLLQRIREVVPQWANPRAAAQARIELSALGDRAGLLGAARLALNTSI